MWRYRPPPPLSWSNYYLIYQATNSAQPQISTPATNIAVFVFFLVPLEYKQSSNNHQLQDNSDQSRCFDSRLQLFKEIQTRSWSFITCIPTWQQSVEKISFSLRYRWKINEISNGRNESFRGCTTTSWKYSSLLMALCVLLPLLFQQTNCFD